MADSNRPDAILVVRGAVAGDRFDRHKEYKRRFGGAMSPIMEQDVEAPAAHLLTAKGDQTLLYPSGHPKAGSDRYAWVEVDHGVKYGWLIPDDAAAPAGPPVLDPAAIRDALIARGVLPAGPTAP
jgi:hypothetical protein